jgi:hypothetical protein
VPDSVVALNGAAPGTLVLGSVMVQGASEVGVSVPFAFTHHLPLESREVVLSQRDPSTGTPIPVASAIIQSVAAIIPLVHDCNGNGIPDSVDIANGISHDLNGNGVPDECEAAVCSVTSVSPGAVGLTQLRYLGGAPNPSHGVVRLSLASGRCESVDLLISDVAGRIVRRWSLQTAGARLLSVDWDGRDESGRHTSSGVYFVTLRGRCGVAYGTLVLAR